MPEHFGSSGAAAVDAAAGSAVAAEMPCFPSPQSGQALGTTPRSEPFVLADPGPVGPWEQLALAAEAHNAGRLHLLYRTAALLRFKLTGWLALSVSVHPQGGGGGKLDGK